MNEIKEARQRVGLTQQQLADKFGIPKRTVENWDGGKSYPPKWAEQLLLEKLNEMANNSGD